MIVHATLLVTLVSLIDRLPLPPTATSRGRGRPKVYSDRLFLKALVIMLVRQLHSINELRSVLDEPTAEMQHLRQVLSEQGRYPTRRTWERRFQALPTTLPAQIGCLGRLLVAQVQPWTHSGRGVAIDSTPLTAKGGMWHHKDRAQGIVPHPKIDTAAHWTKSGWHGWVYGWKLHLVTTVASVWLPLAATLTPANRADSEIAPQLLNELPAEVRFLFGDRHYNRAPVRQWCAAADVVLITPQYGHYPHTDEGKEVRRLLHKVRSVAVENFNEHFKTIFDVHRAVPTKGLARTQCFALGAVLVYQIALWYRFEHGLPLNVGLKPFLKAA